MGSNQKIVQGLMWKLLERFGVAGVQFVLQILLARLLEPELYDILAIMMIFTSLATVFIQRGFSTALIQNKDVTEEDYSSVLWVVLSIAFVMYGMIWFAAPVIADFYAMPEIVDPLRVLALLLFPGALNSVQLARVNRQMDFKKVFRSNLGAILLSGIAGIVVAYMGGGLWALVVQTLLNTVIACIIMRTTSGFHIQFVCNIKRIKSLLSFGWKMLASGLLETLFHDLQTLVIGKKFVRGTLAYYERGRQFPNFLINAINSSVQSVMLPAMSKEQDDRSRVKEMTRTSIMMSSYIISPVMAGLASVATPMVTLLLTEKWLPCVPYVRIFCLSLVFMPIHACNLQAINAMGRSDIFLKLEVIKKVVGTSLLFAAVIFFDSPVAIALSSVMSSLISCFVNAYPNKQLMDYSYLEQARDMLPSLVISVMMMLPVLSVEYLALPSLVTIILQIVVGMGAYLLLSVLFNLKPYRILRSFVIGFLQKKKPAEG